MLKRVLFPISLMLFDTMPTMLGEIICFWRSNSGMANIPPSTCPFSNPITAPLLPRGLRAFFAEVMPTALADDQG